MKHIDTLSEQEKETLVLALARSRDGFAEEEASQLLSWANYTRLQAAQLDLLLGGALFVDLDAEGEPVFALEREELPCHRKRGAAEVKP